MEPLTNDLVMAVMASQDAVITELTRIVTERDAEINYITEQHKAMEKFILDQHRQLVRVKSSDEYESVQALYLERSQELQAAGYSNQLLGERVKQLEDIINDLRRDVDIASEERDDTAKTLIETENKVADLDEKNESQRQAMLIAEEKIIEQHALIQQLKQGNKDLLKDYKRRECTMAELKLEISELQYTKERIVIIEAENDRLVDEIKDFTIDRRETTLEMNNMNTLINSQRQRLDELENAVSIYEHRFLAKGVDVPKRKLIPLYRE
jgi:chromosome segregation ATPase